MARAQGARAQMALAFETTSCTPPASGILRMPFARATLGAEQLAGTLADLTLQRFAHFNGAITRNGRALGNIVAAEITYANTRGPTGATVPFMCSKPR